MKEKMAHFQQLNALKKKFIKAWLMCGCYLKLLIFFWFTLLLLNMENMAELTEEYFWRQFMRA